MNKLMAHLEDVVCLESRGRSGSRELLSIILNLQYRMRFNDINSLLLKLDYNKLSTRCIGILFRITYGNRHLYPLWNTALYKATLVLDKRNVDTQELFKGFILEDMT